jgi:lipoprotein-anchoring transpeptidase ErfK/SrfK
LQELKMGNPMTDHSRRWFLAMAATSAASVTLSACATGPAGGDNAYAVTAGPQLPLLSAGAGFGDPVQMYAAMSDDGHNIPAVPVEQIDPRYYRQMVTDPTGELPGTVVVDTSNHFLYFVGSGGQAVRYGVGLGRQGFEWSGRGVIQWKQRWPRWFPPNEMIDRQPELERYRARQIRGTNNWEGGMEAGVKNPLGARALYIFQNGKDTLFRLHGSPEWWSIGKSVSSGCVRLINQDIIDLYDRVPDGTPMVVTSGLSPVT